MQGPPFKVGWQKDCEGGKYCEEKCSSGFHLEATFLEENLSPAENRKQLIFDARVFCRVKVKVGQKKNFQLLDF